MKISTITLHSAINPGSMIQAYALQQFIIQSGYETEIIDYRPDYIASEGKKIREFVKKLIDYKNYNNREKNFRLFMENHMILSEQRYETYDALKANPPKAECYVAGSDQLWNSTYACGLDKAYYLGFVDSANKISYAVSVGKGEIPQDEIDWINKNVSDYKWISVREGSAKIAMEKSGLQNVDYVCDPVLLLDKKHYMKISTKFELGKYIAIYLVKKSPLLDEFIEILRKKFNYKIVLIGGFTKRCDCDLHIKDVGPKEFLGLLSGAELIIASSFHATVFAHIFQKNFVVILPEGNGARIEEFLNISNTSDQILKSSEDFDKVLSEINFKNDVEPSLNKFIDASKKKFLGVLTSFSEQS